MEKSVKAEKQDIYERNEKKLRYIKNDYIERKAGELARAIDPKWNVAGESVGIGKAIEYFEERRALKFIYVNLKKEFPREDILGYYNVYQHIVKIEKELYEATDPIKIRRGFFTMAHEIGHYILHGQRVRKEILQRDLFGKPIGGPREGIFMTRQETIERPYWNLKDVMERQANHFAACFLMPRNAIENEMRRMKINKPIIVPDVINSEKDVMEYIIGFVKKTGINDAFDVNISPMSYRLKELGWFKKDYGKEVREYERRK